MKMHLNVEQTAKLIELGFEKPKSEVECDLPKGDWRIGAVGICRAYSIGELLAFLPSHSGKWDLSIWHDWNFERWVMCFEPEKQTSAATELIDATYNLIIKLKEEGVI